jgi:hypothetical protein
MNLRRAFTRVMESHIIQSLKDVILIAMVVINSSKF